MKKLRLTLIISSLIFSLETFGAQSLYMHQPHISTRVMGMGGAFAAVADDYLALYYNPAGLAKLEHKQFVGEINAGLTPTILGFTSDLKGAGNDPVLIQNAVSNYFGSH